MFTAGTGDDRTPKDEDAAAPEENAPETPDKKSESEEEDKEGRKLQSPEHARGGGRNGSDAAELTQHNRPGGVREASQDPLTKENIGVVEGGKYAKEEEDGDDDDDEVQTDVSFEGSGVGLDGVDDTEQRGGRQGVLGPQEEVALFAEYNAYGGPRTGGVDVVPEGGGGGRHALGGEPAGWSAQRMAPAQQLGEPSEEVRGRARVGSTVAWLQNISHAAETKTHHALRLVCQCLRHEGNYGYIWEVSRGKQQIFVVPGTYDPGEKTGPRLSFFCFPRPLLYCRLEHRTKHSRPGNLMAWWLYACSTNLKKR